MKTKLLSAAALAALLACSSAAFAAEAKVCLPSVESGATHGPIRDTVEARAVVSWSARVTGRYSLRYANWDNAVARKVGCRRYTSTFGVNLWECRAVATPCRLR